MWASPAAAEAPVAVKETILECGQTTSVSIPSALLLEAGAEAGLLRSRAGTVKERRPLCSGGGACSGVLDGASGDDMMNAHACISKSGRCATCRSQNIRRRCGLCTCRTVVLLCFVGCWWRLRNWRALLSVHLAQGAVSRDPQRSSVNSSIYRVLRRSSLR